MQLYLLSEVNVAINLPFHKNVKSFQMQFRLFFGQSLPDLLFFLSSLFLLSSLCRYCCRMKQKHLTYLCLHISPNLKPCIYISCRLQGISTRRSHQRFNRNMALFQLPFLHPTPNFPGLPIQVQQDPSQRLPWELGRKSAQRGSG